jgi:hypothetical protein
MSILLGVCSFGFYKVNRFLLRGAQRLNARATAKQPPVWRILNGELLERPLALPIVMTSGPRWNPHAVIASAGPIAIKSELRIDTRTADSSAQTWTAVVNSFPDLKTVGSLGSGTGDRLELKPGRYTVILRYYECATPARLPAIEIDGKDAVPAIDIPPAVNDFYKDLKERKSRYYLWLHYYISVILRYEKSLPAGFVRREYLPTGNPETEFFWGALKPGERLDLKPLHTQLRDSRAYVTVYSRASFPLFWRRIDTSQESLEAVDGGAFYLIRAHRGAVSRAAA